MTRADLVRRRRRTPRTRRWEIGDGGDIVTCGSARAWGKYIKKHRPCGWGAVSHAEHAEHVEHPGGGIYTIYTFYTAKGNDVLWCKPVPKVVPIENHADSIVRSIKCRTDKPYKKA